MNHRLTKWEWALLAAIAGVVLTIFMSGCGSARKEASESTSVTRTTSIAEKTVSTPEGPAVVESVKTTTVSETLTKAELNSQTIIQAPPIIKVISTAAEAAVGATPWGGIALAAATAISTAWAAHKTAQSTERGKRADENKADADEGWKIALNKDAGEG